MKKQNQFTVVIPFYNAEDTIIDAVESVLNQTYKASQIILVDDGSTDKSVEIIKKLKEQFKEINYFHQVNNGVSSARNLGIRKSENEYIFFLDADDIWLPRKIQVHNEHLNLHPDCVSSFTNFFTFNENNGKLITKNGYVNKSPLSSHNLALDICRVNGSCSSFMGNKRSIDQLNGFNKDLKFGEDLDLWVRFSNKNVICEINEIAVAIRTSNKKLKDEKLRRSWEISNLYFHIWESNKISLFDKKSKIAARKILRADIRRNYKNPRKILIDYPTRFMKENSEIFNKIFKSKIGYYAYLLLDFWEDFVNMIKKYSK